MSTRISPTSSSGTRPSPPDQGDRGANSGATRCDETPELLLRAYVLSMTPAKHIDEGRFSEADWRQDGVYFVNQQGSVRDLIAHALSQ